LILYLRAIKGYKATEVLLEKIDSIIINSLRSVQPLLISDKHCFECYGYDIIIDSELRPWLIEVNASPSLSATTSCDKIMKYTVIDDVLNIVTAKLSDTIKGKQQADLGGFQTLINESLLSKSNKT
jgi:tubulin polyglutamylase TTLL1